MIEALFLDVDGTLLSFRTHRVPESARAALCEAHARGVRIFIATGRAAGDLAPLEGLPYDGVVALNGAECVLRDGRVVARRPIPRADFERGLELAARFGFPVALELDEGIFVDRVTPEVERLAALVAHPLPETADLRRLFDRNVCCQMCFYCDERVERAVMAELPGLAATRWHPIFVDITVRGVDKASGMRDMLAACSLGADSAMACGDGGNDVPMLRAAGVGVAMGNGCDPAKQAADYVTADVDDDGLAKALKYYHVI